MLKDTWVDRKNDVDYNNANDLNELAKAIIDWEKKSETGGASGVGIEKTEINADGELIVTYTGGNSVNLGKVVGAQGPQGIQGETGAKGDKGDKGEKGDPYTLNEADKAEIVAAAEAVCVAKNQGAANVGKILVVGTDGNLTLTDMPEGGASGDVIGVLDESNNILLSGNLADGTYTLKYENEDGTYTDVCTLEVGKNEEPETPTIANLAAPDATVSGETAWNSGGWCNDSYMAGSSYAYRAATDGKVTTNTIAVEHGDIIYVKGIIYNEATFPQLAIFDESGTYIKHGYVSNMHTDQSCIADLNATSGSDYWYFTNGNRNDGSDVGTRFIRISGMPSGDISDIIITRNQPII